MNPLDSHVYSILSPGAQWYDGEIVPPWAMVQCGKFTRQGHNGMMGKLFRQGHNGTMWEIYPPGAQWDF